MHRTKTKTTSVTLCTLHFEHNTLVLVVSPREKNVGHVYLKKILRQIFSKEAEPCLGLYSFSINQSVILFAQGKGYDTSKHILSCFGGAGGQHACAVAKALGSIFIEVYCC